MTRANAVDWQEQCMFPLLPDHDIQRARSTLGKTRPTHSRITNGPMLVTRPPCRNPRATDTPPVSHDEKAHARSGIPSTASNVRRTTSCDRLPCNRPYPVVKRTGGQTARRSPVAAWACAAAPPAPVWRARRSGMRSGMLSRVILRVLEAVERIPERAGALTSWETGGVSVARGFRHGGRITSIGPSVDSGMGRPCFFRGVVRARWML